MTIDIDQLRRLLNSTDMIDGIDLHANIKPIVRELLDRLEAAEKEVQRLKQTIEAQQLAYREMVKEYQAAADKIAAMEQQEPVAKVRINSITGNPSVDFIPGHRYLHHNSSLYALPGAKGEGE